MCLGFKYVQYVKHSHSKKKKKTALKSSNLILKERICVDISPQVSTQAQTWKRGSLSLFLPLVLGKYK